MKRENAVWQRNQYAGKGHFGYAVDLIVAMMDDFIARTYDGRRTFIAPDDGHEVEVRGPTAREAALIAKLAAAEAELREERAACDEWRGAIKQEYANGFVEAPDPCWALGRALDALASRHDARRGARP